MTETSSFSSSSSLQSGLSSALAPHQIQLWEWVQKLYTRKWLLYSLDCFEMVLLPLLQEANWEEKRQTSMKAEYELWKNKILEKRKKVNASLKIEVRKKQKEKRKQFKAVVKESRFLVTIELSRMQTPNVQYGDFVWQFDTISSKNVDQMDLDGMEKTPSMTSALLARLCTVTRCHCSTCRPQAKNSRLEEDEDDQIYDEKQRHHGFLLHSRKYCCIHIEHRSYVEKLLLLYYRSCRKTCLGLKSPMASQSRSSSGIPLAFNKAFELAFLWANFVRPTSLGLQVEQKRKLDPSQHLSPTKFFIHFLASSLQSCSPRENLNNIPMEVSGDHQIPPNPTDEETEEKSTSESKSKSGNPSSHLKDLEIKKKEDEISQVIEQLEVKERKLEEKQTNLSTKEEELAEFAAKLKAMEQQLEEKLQRMEQQFTEKQKLQIEAEAEFERKKLAVKEKRKLPESGHQPSSKQKMVKPSDPSKQDGAFTTPQSKPKPQRPTVNHVRFHNPPKRKKRGKAGKKGGKKTINSSKSR